MDLSVASVSGLIPVTPLEKRFASAKLSCNVLHHNKGRSSRYGSTLTIRSSYSGDGGRPNSAGVFVGGFILGGIIVGALGCIYAPQLYTDLKNQGFQLAFSHQSQNRKDLMRKLPKFIYDEEKALEKTRKVLTEKIAQLNSAIDEVSSQLRADDKTNGAAIASDEVEAAL